MSELALVQCNIIGELLARSEREPLFQCSKPSCKRYDQIGMSDVVYVMITARYADHMNIVARRNTRSTVFHLYAVSEIL